MQKLGDGEENVLFVISEARGFFVGGIFSPQNSKNVGMRDFWIELGIEFLTQ